MCVNTRAALSGTLLASLAVVGGCVAKPPAGGSPGRTADAGERVAVPDHVPAGPAPAGQLVPATSRPASPTLEPERLPTGRPCRVHLRRDALGLSGVAPLSIGQVSPAGRSASMEGTIERATDDWVVLRGAARTYWVRVDTILAVEFFGGQ